jgi:hypothetical protein
LEIDSANFVHCERDRVREARQRKRFPRHFVFAHAQIMLNVADVVWRESVGVFLGEGGEIGVAVSLVHGGAF